MGPIRDDLLFWRSRLPLEGYSSIQNRRRQEKQGARASEARKNTVVDPHFM